MNGFLFPTKEKRQKIREYFDSFPDRVSRMRLARSILGEEIDLYRIGYGGTKLLYVGAHHGSEHITSSLIYEFLELILNSKGELYGVDISSYLSKFSIFAVPVLNPDGVELSISGIFDNPLADRQCRMAKGESFEVWQSNARGVDLNHNYSVGFFEYKNLEAERNIEPGATLYSGEYPESEPESYALASLARTIDLSLCVSLHSQGEEIYYFPKDERAYAIASKAGTLLGYDICEPSGTALYGGFCDYTGCSLGIPSLTLEVGRGKNPLPESEFYRIKENVLKALFLLPTLL